MAVVGFAPRRGTVLTIVLLAVLTAAFRFLALTGLSNDHFVHLTAAQQMLFGDWPTRDFIDVGRPLTIVASAAAQRVLGQTWLSEGLLVCAAFGLSAALTAAIVLQLTGSLGASIGAVVFEVAAFPRTYSYPKVLATALGLWLIAYYVRSPNVRRQILMAVSVAVAFLFRHDLGLFVGIGGLVASLLAVPGDSWPTRGRRAMTFAGLVVLLVAPYLIYVQVNGGLWNYIITARDASTTEPGYVWPNPLTAGPLSVVHLLYVFHLLPVAALGALAAAPERATDRWRTSFVIALACVAISENFGLMRDVLQERIPDAIVPAVVLGAWMAHRAWQARPPYLSRALVLGALLYAVITVGKLGRLGDNLDRADVTFTKRSAQLRGRFSSEMPSRAASALMPFFAYLDRCTTEQHRLFLGGMIPEVAYLARRPFAGGGYEHYNFDSPENQQHVVDRLRRQLVPFALIPTGADTTLDDLPIVAAYIHGRYAPMADLLVAGNEHIQILVDTTLSSVSVDAATTWPCFKGQS